MSRRLSTNFRKINLDHYLYNSIRSRFQEIETSEFEDFIAYLFKKNGYSLIQASYSSDFGADLIVKREGIKTAILIKRYFKLHRVGVNDIELISGAQEYYQCDQGLVITTSSFTPQAKNAARESRIILWDWDRLLKGIADTFLDSKHPLDYYKGYPKQLARKESDQLKLEVGAIEVAEDSDDYLLVLRLTSLVDEDQHISCELPVIITDSNFQFSALNFADESFTSGVLYALSHVEMIARFSPKHLAHYRSRDRVLLNIHLAASNENVVLEQKLGKSGTNLSKAFFGWLYKIRGKRVL